MRAVGILVVLAACGDSVAEPVPPVLPGELEPACTIGPTRTFLISHLGVPPGYAFPIDLSLPPEQFVSSSDYPFLVMQTLTDQVPAATERAATGRHILWTVSERACTDTDELRVSLRRASAITDGTTPPRLTLSDDPFVESVGTIAAGQSRASYGIGASPIGLNVDPSADSAEPAWLPAYAVDVRATESPSGLSGTFTFAFSSATSRQPLSAAIARLLTLAAAEHPECPGDSCPLPWLSRLIVNFDGDDDRQFSTDEIATSSNFTDLLDLGPRLDVLTDVDGVERYWPEYDDAKDALAVSYSFEAIEVSAGP